MFRRFILSEEGRFAQAERARAEALFRLHPADLAALVDLAWDFRVNNTNEPLGHPDHRSDLAAFSAAFLDLFPSVDANSGTFEQVPPLRGFVRWDHLIYAYMVESTRIYEIFRRVMHDFLHGEQQGVPDSDVQFWLRNTEELIYREPAPFFVTSVYSDIRRDTLATRRNAYYRMFGMDLIHGKGEATTHPYEKAKVANTEFVAIFEEFLREVWVGIANEANATGENPTDDAAIADLASKLFDMLRSRRQGGNLAREEFWAVSLLAWLHLTVEFDSPVVRALRAEASSADQRLLKIAERVGLPAPARTKSFFDLADPMSRLLILIEFDTFRTTATVPALYERGPLQDDLRTIITHWSLATGHDLKTRRTRIAAGV